LAFSEEFTWEFGAIPPKIRPKQKAFGALESVTSARVFGYQAVEKKKIIGSFLK